MFKLRMRIFIVKIKSLGADANLPCLYKILRAFAPYFAHINKCLHLVGHARNQVRMKRVLAAVLICLCLIVAGIGAIGAFVFFKFCGVLNSAEMKEDWDGKYATVYSDIPYGEKERNRFDLYIPAVASKDKTAAVMLFIHGGSWMGGDKSEIAYACRRYAKAGYFTAAMNYSLIDLKDNKSSIPMMLDEIGLCLGKIMEKAGELGYRIDKAAVSGFSAGGHLALLYAYSRAESSPLPIAFAAEQVGPVSFVEDWDDANANSPEKISEAIKLVGIAAGREIGKSDVLNGEAKRIMASISPLQLVNEKTPPTVMGYGGKDWLVPLQNGEKLAAALGKSGVDFIFIRYPNSGHMLESDMDSTKRYYESVLAFAKKYFGY